MSSLIFAAPYFTANALRFIEAVAALPGVPLGLISQEAEERLAPALRARIAAHYRVDDALDAEQLVGAATWLAQRLGPIQRMLGVVEQIQVPLAVARARLGVAGMSVEAAQNFRDKARMKTLLRAAGLPCARHRLVRNVAEAWAFAAKIGFPLVAKPPAGAAAQGTFRVDDHAGLTAALDASAPSESNAVLLEEFVTGDEHSFDTFTRAGRPVFHTLTRYHPTPLEVLRNPWIQWAVVLPREVNDPQYDDIRRAAFRALEVLGMDAGLSHMEWFRRADGSLAISEVGARPPGAQITTLISRACDFDAVAAWARLMAFDEFAPPVQRYAVGAAYLRGQGQGRIRAIHGWEQMQREVGHLLTDVKLPEIGPAPAATYEGDGYVILRHAETGVVERALQRVISTVRVELG